MRKVLYISGSRADYGPARRLLLEIQRNSDFELGVLVTGMHLDPNHGETWSEIENDSLKIITKIHGRLVGDSLGAMAASIGLYLYGMSHAIESYEPDIVLVLGDRSEQLAGAMAAAFQNIAVVHLCGGTLSGSIDDSIRHAITKFSHYHFPMVHEAAQRILQMGENPENISIVGLPGGNISPDVTYTSEQIYEKFSLPKEQPYILVIQHAVTQSQSEAVQQITETLEAVSSLNYPTLLANPNDDAGSKAISEQLVAYAEKYCHLKILHPPKSRELFASIMAHAGVLVGNSSSGIVEAMSVNTPVVNIGDRQRGRESLAYLLNTDYQQDAIVDAIRKALEDPDFVAGFQSFLSEGIINNTEELVINQLATLELDISSNPKVFHRLNHRANEL